MTRAVFYSRENLLTCFLVEGPSTAHSSDETGRMVCTAVSSAAYMATNTLTEIVGAEAQIQVEDGYMKCVITSDPLPCQMILQGFLLHMRQLAAQYKQQIEVHAEVR